ncbi:2-polyprenyl-3-methyl-5-hydroxy-6-metoxy-1,4-benzoquinol methylase [Sphingorhabdus rigui]|uniref:2-polyprenyl-3-methyl-5-hydroxy-6-metoxy-1, 4-benzoquinol methylase n=1 Tax=Sphingorhabdus rigui TaxID=1282858 RepID=A0A840AZI9_9SPHN|nr:class I SAM-dependent methyltransferase [Sphingorhabdus rigui]MBB3943819.1 2-polyprenyl-3-methyl-5-hydroxy-6-metoxy-1,4-benzoquinol methylase [Sphingorhabdus rigui]
MVSNINLDCWFPKYDVLSEIDRYLIEDWHIEYLLTHEQILAKMKKVGLSRWQRFERLCKKKNEKLVTDAMADFDIHAFHVSDCRRTYILDLIALSFSWMQRSSVSGKVIDIGCQNGILLKFLAQKFANEFTGIDPSAKAIEAAKEQLKGLKNVELQIGKLPFETEQKYDLALCIDVLHHLKPDQQSNAISCIFGCLNAGGSAIISTADFHDHKWWSAIQPSLNEFGVELIAAGRVGGAQHGGTFEVKADWPVTGVGIFKMTENRNAVVDYDALNNAHTFYWDNFFQHYANFPLTPWHEKTLSFEAAQRKSAEDY